MSTARLTDVSGGSLYGMDTCYFNPIDERFMFILLSIVVINSLPLSNIT